MHPRNRAERQQARYVKGMRRIREDRAQHGGDCSCPCFKTNGHDVFFARFADYPTVCSGPCCGNPRRWWGERTRQERRSDDM